MRSTRLVSTVSNGSSILSHNDDVLASSSFTLEEYSPEPRSVELTIVESRTPICVSEIYHEHFYEHVSEKITKKQNLLERMDGCI